MEPMNATARWTPQRCEVWTPTQNGEAALAALQQDFLKPAQDKAMAYGRQVYDITAAAQADVTKLAETQLADAQEKLNALVETAVKNAPAGTESAVALVKSAVAAANNAYESAHKAAKQAADIAEANFTAVTNTAMKASQAAAKSVELAFNELNKAGGAQGIAGCKLAFDLRDAQSQGSVAVDQARQLVDLKKVPAIIGGIISSVSIPIVTSVTGPAGVVQISPASTSPGARRGETRCATVCST